MSNSFIDIRFPPRIGLNAVGGPGFLTNLATMESGEEARNQEWASERGEWEVSLVAKTGEAVRQFKAFFRVVGGMASSFRYKDWTDYICLPGEGFFVDSDGSPSGKQLVKRYTFSYEGFSYTYDRKITKPVSGTVTFDGGGTLDYATGIVYGGSQFTTGSPLSTWYGEFDCCVRFDTDKMRAQVDSRNHEDGLIISWNNIMLVEVTDE